MQNTEVDIKKYDTYFITPSYDSNFSKNYFEKIEKILDYGVKILQFRSKNLSEEQYCIVAKKIYKLCQKYNSFFIVNGLNNFNRNKYCNGVHLTSKNLLHGNISKISSNYIIIGSCHNIEEIEICNRFKFKFIVISPVLDSGNKIGIGWYNFRKLAENSNVPVFALGGMNYKRDINTVKSFGGIGIASMSHFYKLF